MVILPLICKITSEEIFAGLSLASLSWRIRDLNTHTLLGNVSMLFSHELNRTNIGELSPLDFTLKSPSQPAVVFGSGPQTVVWQGLLFL